MAPMFLSSFCKLKKRHVRICLLSEQKYLISTADPDHTETVNENKVCHVPRQQMALLSLLTSTFCLLPTVQRADEPRSDYHIVWVVKLCHTHTHTHTLTHTLYLKAQLVFRGGEGSVSRAV